MSSHHRLSQLQSISILSTERKGRGQRPGILSGESGSQSLVGVDLLWVVMLCLGVQVNAGKCMARRSKLGLHLKTAESSELMCCVISPIA